MKEKKDKPFDTAQGKQKEENCPLCKVSEETIEILKEKSKDKKNEKNNHD